MKVKTLGLLVTTGALIWVIPMMTAPQSNRNNNNPQQRAPRGRFEIDEDKFKEKDVVFRGTPIVNGSTLACEFPNLIFTGKAPTGRGQSKEVAVDFDQNCDLRIRSKREGPATEPPGKQAMAQRTPLMQLASNGALTNLLRAAAQIGVTWKGYSVRSVVYTVNPGLFFARQTLKTGTLNFMCCDYPGPYGAPPYIMTTGFAQSCDKGAWFSTFIVKACDPETDIWDAYYGDYAIRSSWGHFNFPQTFGPGLDHDLWEGTKATANVNNSNASECLKGFGGTLPYSGLLSMYWTGYCEKW